MATLVTAVMSTPAFFASWALARFSSRRVMAKNRSRGISGALCMAMRQLVLQGLPTTRMRTSAAAFFWMAWPWPMKILPLMPSKSLRSMPALRGTLPTSNAQFTSRKPSSRFAVGHDALEQRKRAVVQLHHHAAERGQGGFDFNQVEDDGLIRAEHRAGGDAEQEGITDLAGGAGNCDSNG